MALFEYLVSKYPPANRGPKRVPGRIPIDRRTKGDTSPSYCRITVDFRDGDKDAFALTLWNTPWNKHVAKRAGEMDGVCDDNEHGRCLVIEMSSKRVTELRRLAEAIRKVTGRHRHYEDRNWKWVTNRVAEDLQVFADHLMEFRRERRNGDAHDGIFEALDI